MFLLYRSKHVALIVQMITLAHAHLCIEDPPQRLATGNRTTVDCFQNSNPPCGKDFPQNASTNPKAIKPGSLYGVHLHMPTRHYDPEKPGSYVVSIQKVGDPEFKTLGQWRDGTEEFKILTVKLPDVSGKYLLQAIYQPAGRAYYSCADILLQEGAPDQALPAGAELPMTGDENTAVRPQLPTAVLLTVALLVMRCALWVH